MRSLLDLERWPSRWRHCLRSAIGLAVLLATPSCWWGSDLDAELRAEKPERADKIAQSREFLAQAQTHIQEGRNAEAVKLLRGAMALRRNTVNFDLARLAKLYQTKGDTVLCT